LNLYTKTSLDVSETIIRNYSTSFYWSSLFFKKDIREAIFAIYGFVRIADEIVDTFHDYNKEALFDKFESDLREALDSGISLNPVLNAFVRVVRMYGIEMVHIQAFMDSMRADLNKKVYLSDEEMSTYIFGSAEVVGLMCLKVFCNGQSDEYKLLEHSAVKLGSAFQKVNFLRDIKTDMQDLNRSYFPTITASSFSDESKAMIVADIESDFEQAKIGIKALPRDAKLAVLIAYYYYLALLRKIKKLPAAEIVNRRIRVSNTHKFLLIVKAYMVNGLNIWR
jgi:15-cis-phytoene synthase